ncbi:MAG: YggS family pyridoxal phosphate-dependent enzyme [Acidobacteriota bacterium]
MNSVEQTIAERLATIRSRVHEACQRSGRDPEEVHLLGISKRQPLEKIRAAIDAGLRTLGENQIQEAVAKSAELPVGIEWHFVGHLQSNKAKAAARLFDFVHSVDRPKIARRLDAEAKRLGRRIQGFAQVNLGAEVTKKGYAVEGLVEALKPLAELEHLRLVGLMAIPRYEQDLESARRWFRELRELRDQVAAQHEWHDFPGLLSMGMSHDFEIAIEEGATHIRVGTSIFGQRSS